MANKYSDYLDDNEEAYRADSMEAEILESIDMLKYLLKDYISLTEKRYMDNVSDSLFQFFRFVHKEITALPPID